jgi:mono/diheme cytochrome c family protein
LALRSTTKTNLPARAGWYAFNITSDKESVVGAWSDDERRSYLSAGHASGRGTAAGPMGEAVDQSFADIAPSDIRPLVAYLPTVPPIASSDLSAKLAPPAPASPKQGNATADAVGKRVFEGACVHCHDWTGISQISPFATIAGTRGVNDRTGTNFVQIVISGTTRHTPDEVLSMPAFGDAYSDKEIAAVANYVTARFGAEPSKLTDKDVAELRRQTGD